MGVQRRVNWISQQRVDVPDVRAIESAVSNDIDQLFQAFVTGTEQGYVLRGFEILMAGAIGGAASGLQMLVDPGAVMHTKSSQSGTIYMVPTGTAAQQLNSATNPIVDGAFAPSAINYVGLEYERFIDDSTSAQVYIWDPTSNDETTKIAPRAQILRYRLKITTSTWASNVLPIAIVTTDAGNNVTNISDGRTSLYRLATGGATPNQFYQYPWTGQSEGRTENPSSSSSNAINPFHGGDKMLGSLKDWMNAIMTSFLEVKGTPYWYTLGTSGSLASLQEDLARTVTVGKGAIAHSADVAGLINWDEDIYLRVIGANLSYKFSANASSSDITLGDNQVAYVNLIRNVNITPNLIFTNGSKIVQSVGAISWTAPLQSGDWVRLASDTNAQYYEVDTVDSTSQITLLINFAGTSTGGSGAKAKYALGTYNTSAAPSSNRDIYIADRQDVPVGPDIFWFLFRSDNAGVIPKVYVRFIGSELEQGETEEIDDGVPRQLLAYIGSPLESASKPQYVSALNPGSVREVQDLTCGSAATMTSNQYFYIGSSDDARKYYVWVNKNGTGVDPEPAADRIGIEWVVSTGQTNAQTATTLASILGATAYSDFAAATRANPNQHVVRVTNSSAGACTLGTAQTLGAPFAVALVTAGTGLGNHVINDDNNLTLAIKKLDDFAGDILRHANDPNYDEPLTVVVGAPADSNEVTGPISSGTNLQLPLNSRLLSIVQRYIVGKGALEVFLNGQFMQLGSDWAEVGTTNTFSKYIQISRDLVVDDVIEFRFGGGGASGGGAVGPTGPTGPTGPPGSDAAGGPIAISTKVANYTVLLTDCFLKANCAGGAITLTLPTAASATGRIFYIKKIDATANLMTIAANGLELIDGLGTQTTDIQYTEFALISDGSTWSIF